MDAIVKQELRFLPALAEQIALWFPELGGRALAVSEVSITKENVPTLPLAMVAFIRSAASPPANSNSSIFEVTDTFIIDFWLEPARYKKANGTETPFWSYYDYEAIRDTLLTNLSRWDSPGGERIAFRGMTIEAEPLAVTLTFTFMATFRWCAPKSTDLGEPFTIGFSLCTPKACDPCEDLPKSAVKVVTNVASYSTYDNTCYEGGRSVDTTGTGLFVRQDSPVISDPTIVNGITVYGPADLNVQIVHQVDGVLIIDRRLGENCSLLLDGNVTEVVINEWPVAGVTGKLRMVIINSGSFTITGWPVGTIWPGGEPPDISTGTDILLLMSDDNGATIFGSVVAQDYH